MCNNCLEDKHSGDKTHPYLYPFYNGKQYYEGHSFNQCLGYCFLKRGDPNRVFKPTVENHQCCLDTHGQGLGLKLHNLGLTLHGTSFATGMARFHVVVAISLLIVASFARPTNAVAAGLVSFVEDATGCRSVVHLALAYLLAVWFHVNMSYIVMVMATREGGYDNSAPRTMVPGSAALGRLKAAADNTQDSLVQFLVAVAVLSGAQAGDSLDEEAEGAVKRWAVLAMLARTAYPIAYVLDLDLLRTMMFGVGFFS